MAARSIASLTLSFGLVSIPVKLYSATETASAEGWSRPLLAWLEVQARVADQAGDALSAQALRRRMALVSGTR